MNIKKWYKCHQRIGMIIILIIIDTTLMFSQSNSILQSLVDQLGGKNSIQIDYNNGKKWVAYFVAKPIKTGIASGGVKVLVDLTDVAGVTAEGRNGWVTIWIDVVAELSKGGPFGCGVQLRSFGANAPDSPTALFDLTSNLNVSYFPIDVFNVSSSGGISTFDTELSATASSIEIGETFSVHGLAFEVKLEMLNLLLNKSASSGISLQKYSENIILNITSPGATELFSNPFFDIRFATPDDDPNETLIQEIYGSKLVQGVDGVINVRVKVKESKNYYVRAWDGDGVTYPDWVWQSKSSETIYLNADQEYMFKLYVKPNSHIGDFSFWLYQQDMLNTYKIVEKIRTNIYAAAAGTDYTPPIVAFTSPNSNAVIVDSIKAIINVSDAESGISRVEYYLGNQYIGFSDKAPYEFWVNGIAFEQATYKLAARAFDNAGNGSQDFVNVIIENSSPTLSNGTVTPISGIIDDQFNFNVEYKSLRAIKPDSVCVVINGFNVKMSALSNDWVKGVTFTCFKTFPIGTYSYYFEASVGGKTIQANGGGITVNSQTPKSLTLTLSTSNGNPGDIIVAKASVYPPKYQYPIQFALVGEPIGVFDGKMPILTNANGVATVNIVTTQTGTCNVTATGLNNSNLSDQKIISIKKPQITLSISITANRKEVIDGVVQYKINLRVEKDGQPYPNFIADLATDYGYWLDNGEKKITKDSQGDYLPDYILCAQANGTANITISIDGNQRSIAVPIQFILPPFTPIRDIAAPGVKGISFSPIDDKIAYTCDNDFKIRIYDVSEDKIVKEITYFYPGTDNTVEVKLTRFSPDGTKLLAIGRGARIYNLDGSSIAENPSITCYGEDGDAHWVDNSKILLAYKNKTASNAATISVFNSSLVVERTLFSSNLNRYGNIDIAGNYALLSFSTYSNGDNEGSSYIYDISTWNPIWPFPFNPGGNGKEYANSLSSDGSKAIIFDSYDGGLLYVVNSGTGVKEKTIPSGSSQTRWCSRNPILGTNIMVMSYTGISLIDFATGTVLKTDKTFTTIDGADGDWSPNGETFAASTGNNIFLYAPFDDINPTIAIASPQNNFNTFQTSTTLSGNVDDNKGIATVKYRINSEGWNDLPLNTMNQFSTSINLTNGTNTIEVQTTDICGRLTHIVITGTKLTPILPSAPVLLNPSNMAKNLPVTLTLWWKKSEGASSYKFQIAKDSLFKELVIEDAEVSDTLCQVNGLINDTIYYWRVYAINDVGTSMSSAVYCFKTIRCLPWSPILVAPSDNARFQPLTAPFEWYPVPLADQYHIQIATDSQFVSGRIEDSTNTNRLFVKGLKYHSTYRWRVLSQNDAGTSDWSPVRKFTTSFPPIDSSHILPGTPVSALSKDTVLVRSCVFISNLTGKNTPLPEIEAWFGWTSDTSALNPLNWENWRPMKYTSKINGNGDEYSLKITDLPGGNYIYLIKFVYGNSIHFAGIGDTAYNPIRKNYGRFYIVQRSLSISQYQLTWQNVLMGGLYTQHLAITNTGNDTIAVTKITPDGTEYYSSLQSFRLLPGATIIDSIKFIPVRLGKSSTLIVYQSNAFTSPDTVRLVGQSQGIPVLGVSRHKLEFGPMLLHRAIKDTLILYNNGTDTLKITSIVVNNSWVSIFKSSYNVPPQKYVIDTIYLQPKSTGEVSEKIIIRSNSPTNSDTILVVGKIVPTHIKDIYASIPTVFSVEQNYPNPFNPSTSLEYGLPMPCFVKIQIFNILGQMVGELVNEHQTTGFYRITWNANVSSGLYFYRINAISVSDPSCRFTDVKKMLLLR